MKSYAFFAIFMLVQPLAFAEDLMDPFYNRLTQAFSTERCQNPAAPMSASKPCGTVGGMPASNQGDLQNFSETSFYNQLGDLEVARLKCSADEWTSYSDFSGDGRANQEFMVAKINSILPDLQMLKNEIGKLVSETQLLRGKLPSQFETRENMEPRYMALRNEFLAKNEKAKQLMGAYEMRLSEIPNSDNALVRDFVEDHLATFSFKKEATLINAVEFQNFTKKISDSFTNSANEMKKLKSGNTYNLSIKQQAQLSSDPTLIAQLTAQNPDAANSLPYLQCSAKQRMQTKEVVELAANVGSLLIPIGALAVARAARAAVVLRAPQMARGFEQGARALGWTAMITGRMQSMSLIWDACFKKSTANLQGECRKTPKLLIEKHESTSCAWEAILAATPALSQMASGYLVLKTADNTSTLAKFIESMRGKLNLRAQNLAVAGSLSNADRVLAAEGILGRSLSNAEKTALLSAHEVGGLKTYGQYTAEEIEQKRAILAAVGISEREREILLWKGIAGFNKAEMIPLAQKRATEYFGRPITAAQAEAIVGDMDLNKTRAQRLQSLIGAGFTQAQAEDIMTAKIHQAGSVSAAVAAAPKPPPAATPTPVPPPAPTQAYASASTATNRPVPDGLSRIADRNANLTPTEARMALSDYAGKNGIRGSNSQEINFKAMETLADQVFADAKNTARALDNPRLSESDRKKLSESFERIKARCQALPTLATGAGLNGSSLQSSLQARIREVCN